MNPKLSVKSLIVDGENLLIVRRSPDDRHAPGIWGLPGGGLEPGEGPFEGLRRETMEETGLEIEIRNPVRVHHFKRDDGRPVTMITFLCRPLSTSVVLDHENVDYSWEPIEDAHKKLHPAYAVLTKENMMEGLSAPLHPGAEKYYKEAGLK